MCALRCYECDSRAYTHTRCSGERIADESDRILFITCGNALTQNGMTFDLFGPFTSFSPIIFHENKKWKTLRRREANATRVHLSIVRKAVVTIVAAAVLTHSQYVLVKKDARVAVRVQIFW